MKLVDTEQERDQLQLELQKALQDGSQSDISESVKEQQKQLIKTLHYKNEQISSLLKDLEVDNLFLIVPSIKFVSLFLGKWKWENSIKRETIAGKKRINWRYTAIIKT